MSRRVGMILATDGTAIAAAASSAGVELRIVREGPLADLALTVTPEDASILAALLRTATQWAESMRKD
jgi:hypothetical protein